MKIFVLAILFLMLSLTTFGQQRQAVSYDLGPEVYSTYRRANGYGWYAWGYVYASGTYRNRSACEYDESAAVGTYAIFGTSGNPDEHQARYRITVSGESVYFQVAAKAFDENGKPNSYLLDLVRIINGQPRFDDPLSFIEFTPRSSDCFGGTVKLFFGGNGQ